MKTIQGNCECCLMPFKKDPKKENREHEKYCSYCFTDGKLTYEGTDVNEFKKGMREGMIAHGESKLKAHVFAFMAGFAPRWRKS